MTREKFTKRLDWYPYTCFLRSLQLHLQPGSWRPDGANIHQPLAIVALTAAHLDAEMVYSTKVRGYWSIMA